MRLTPDHDALDVANKVRENIVVLTVDETLVVGRLDSSSHLVGVVSSSCGTSFVWCTGGMVHHRTCENKGVIRWNLYKMPLADELT